MVNVRVFKSPDMFAEFGRVSVFRDGMMQCEVSVSCLEVVSLSPTYVLEVLLSLRLTIAW